MPRYTHTHTHTGTVCYSVLQLDVELLLCNNSQMSTFCCLCLLPPSCCDWGFYLLPRRISHCKAPLGGSVPAFFFTHRESTSPPTFPRVRRRFVEGSTKSTARIKYLWRERRVFLRERRHELFPFKFQQGPGGGNEGAVYNTAAPETYERVTVDR